MFGREDFRIAREAHYKRFFGEIDSVVHSMSVDLLPVHVDIYQSPPTGDRRYWTLITGGMSDVRQPALAKPPAGVAPRSELFLYARQLEDWMPAVLKGLAEMPFERATALHWGHTVPNGSPITDTAGHFTSFFFLPPCCEAEAFQALRLDGDQVAFLMLVPITEAERVYAIEHGSAALGQRMDDANLDFIFDVTRNSLV